MTRQRRFVADGNARQRGEQDKVERRSDATRARSPTGMGRDPSSPRLQGRYELRLIRRTRIAEQRRARPDGRLASLPANRPARHGGAAGFCSRSRLVMAGRKRRSVWVVPPNRFRTKQTAPTNAGAAHGIPREKPAGSPRPALGHAASIQGSCIVPLVTMRPLTRSWNSPARARGLKNCLYQMRTL